jgi:hypothetical protein
MAYVSGHKHPQGGGGHKVYTMDDAKSSLKPAQHEVKHRPRRARARAARLRSTRREVVTVVSL